MNASIGDALGAAITLSREGRLCFPCLPAKRPATPRGFRDATADPDMLRALWAQHPGPLVGVATGAASGIDVLDLDKKHREAVVWWIRNRHRLARTWTHRTRSGGLHLLFQHAPDLRCWTGRPVIGIDGRAEGGYVVWWPAAGLPVLCDAPPAPWPTWLLKELNPPRSEAVHRAWPPTADLSRYRARSRYAVAALRDAANRVALAPIGSRNQALNAAAYSIARLVAAGMLDGQGVADTLATAAVAAGLTPREIAATLRSAFDARGLL